MNSKFIKIGTTVYKKEFYIRHKRLINKIEKRKIKELNIKNNIFNIFTFISFLLMMYWALGLKISW